MTENEILELAKSILAEQADPKRWGLAEHIALIGKVAKRHVLPELILGKDGKPTKELGAPALQVKSFRASLATKGLGGNASAFRQWLEKLKLVPASAAALAKEYSD